MWLCVRFVLLPLESLWLNASATAVAVREQNQIVCVNQDAYQSGVRQGQSVATAYAMNEGLHLVERQVEQERATLQKMALQLYPFSPVLSIQEPEYLLLEIGRSLTLFHGLDNLLQQLKAVITQHKLTLSLGLAPTPKAAQLFTQLPWQASYQLWDARTKSFNLAAVKRLIEQQSVSQLPLPKRTLANIKSLGIDSLAELMQLPSAALNKRFGRQLVDYIEQLLGLKPDPQKRYEPTVEFNQTLSFLDVIHQREALLFPMRRLLDDLVYFLRLYQKSGQSLVWTLQDNYHQSSQFEVHLTDATIDLNRYLELTRLQLESVQLTGPIELIGLTMPKLFEHQAQTLSLLEHTQDFTSDLHFANKIKARLGHNSCLWLVQNNAVIPEFSGQLKPQVSEPIKSKAPPKRQGTRVSNKPGARYRAPDELVDNQAQTTALVDSSGLPHDKIRPSWLLPTPQAIGSDAQKLYWHSRLTIVSQVERITHYWWKKAIARDYYIAQSQQGHHYWIFYDQHKQSWFVQGVFA
ncbi:MAG: DNA polymerase Y family protein [Gammaproteobacteria bacterium]|nr:DNA polymerase Y family protein [Gammaproteobacteria bacterium]